VIGDGVDRPERSESSDKTAAQRKLTEYRDRKPLLVVGSPERSKRWKKVLAVGTALALLTYNGASIANDFHFSVPWARNADVVRLGSFGILIVTVVVAARYVRKRTGSVTFHEDRIVFEKNVRANVIERAVVSFDELAGFRDDSADFVQLAKKCERFHSPLLAVPTATEDERVKVLALLDSKGVRRLTAE